MMFKLVVQPLRFAAGHLLAFSIAAVIVAAAEVAVATFAIANEEAPCANPATCTIPGAEIDDEATIKLRAKTGTGPKTGIISDRRMKHDLQPVGVLPDGLPVYAFQFAWETKVRVGLVAQDLAGRAETKAAVLTLPNGLLGIDYAMLGLRMATEREWIADGPAALVATYKPRPGLEPEEQPFVLYNKTSPNAAP